jgi:hypothetical protein
MNKIFLFGALLFLLSVIFIPAIVLAQGLVPCSGTDCTIESFFTMMVNVYTFIVLQIATPLAVIALVVGGIFMMLAAGNPNLMSTGKKIFWSAIIGLVLVFASYLIISFILTTIGFRGNWANPF